MKYILALFLLWSNLAVSQLDYLDGSYTTCPIPNTPQDREAYRLGIDCIKANMYIDRANKLFLNLILKDSTFCDAYFFAAYTYRLAKINDHALAYFIMADSLSGNKSFIFKRSAAYMATQMGSFNYAKRKYKEMIEYFPENPEGYYGVAATSVFTGDFQEGLDNMKLALDTYKTLGLTAGPEVFLTKGILLTQTQKYSEGIEVFEKISGKITKIDEFKMYYAYCMIKQGRILNDESMIKKAKRMYGKVSDKTLFSAELTSEFK